MELASLHATDKIQRDIEDALARSGLFYERRKNYYVNLGHTPAEIVTPLYVAAGYIALVLKHPEKAASIRSKFMRSPESYDAVFSTTAPLEVWPKIARILKLIDLELEKLRPTGRGTEKFLKGWRYITAFLLLSRSIGRFTFSATEISSYDISQITDGIVTEIWQDLNSIVPWARSSSPWTNANNVVAACSQLATKKNISGIEMLIKRGSNRLSMSPRRSPSTPLTDEFVNRVRLHVPPQPWKPGIHKRVATELGCDTSAYFAAVDRLIEDGVFFRQKDGVLYDLDGNIVSFDPERVDPDTLALRSSDGGFNI